MTAKRFDVVAPGELPIDFMVSGDRDFSFCRSPGADMTLTADDLTAMLCFANTAAYLAAIREGTVRSMPERVQAEALL